MGVVDFELALRATDAGYAADARLTQPDSQVESVLAVDVPVALDPASLLALTLDAREYGRALTTQLFAVGGQLLDAWRTARAQADGANLPLRLRLRLAATASDLHALCWETLCDPLTNTPMACDERLRLVRYLEASDTRPITLGSKPILRTLLVVANPLDLESYGLNQIDVEGEVRRVRNAIGDVPLTLVGDHETAVSRRSTLRAIQDALREEPLILCLICHGRHDGDETVLWLEDETGKTARVLGSEVCQMLAQLARPPLLAMLLACESGGVRHNTGALAALGPRLAKSGIGAIVAMQSKLSMIAAATLLPTLFKTLAEDGAIDRAVSVARATLRSSDEWWIPALWLRLREGRLWREGTSQPFPELRTVHDLLSIYRQRIRDATAWVNLAGIPLPRDREGRYLSVAIPLDQVYIRIESAAEAVQRPQEEVELRQLEQAIVGGTPRLDAVTHLRTLGEYIYRQGRLAYTDARQHTVDPLLALQQHHRLVILGPPGAGKSTLLRFLARTVAAEPAGAMPILVSLRDYATYRGAGGTATLRTFALDAAAGGDTTLRQALEQESHYLWLLDALDEAQGWRSQILEQVRNLSGDLVLTSRPFGYHANQLAGLPHFEVLPLTIQDVKRFLYNWFGVVATAQGRPAEWVTERVTWLTEHLAAHPRLAALTRNPLLVTFLAILASDTTLHTVPAQRAALYRRYVEDLFNGWEAQRRPQQGPQGRHTVTLGALSDDMAREAALESLYRIGWYLHLSYNGGPTTYDATRKTLISHLAASLAPKYGLSSTDAERTTRAILDFWCEAGMIEEWSLQHTTYLAFRHLIFQEYFAAFTLASISDTKTLWRIIAPHLHDPRWREIILLIAGELGDMKGRESDLTDLVERIRKIVPMPPWLFWFMRRRDYLARPHWKLLIKIGRFLNDAQIKRLAEQYLQRRLLLAGQMLVDDSGVERAAAEKITIWLILLMFSPILQQRADASNLLHRMPTHLRDFATQQLINMLHKLGNNKSYLRERTDIINALGDLGNSTPLVLDILVNAIHDRNKWIRYAAASALGDLGNTTESVLAVLADTLHDPDADVRGKAVEAIGKLANITPSIMDSLVDTLHDPEATVRKMTLYTLRKLNKFSLLVLGALINSLHDPDDTIQLMAIRVLSKPDNFTPWLQDALVDTFRDSDKRVQYAVVEILGGLGVINQPILDVLINALHDTDEQIQFSAALAFSNLSHTDPSTIGNTLTSFLRDPDVNIRISAGLALGLLVRANKSLTDILAARLRRDPDERVRAFAVNIEQFYSMSSLDSGPLISMLQHEDADYRYAAAEILGEKSLATNSILDALRLALYDPSRDVRRSVAKAIGNLGNNSSEILNALTNSLKDPDEMVRSAAAESLGKLSIGARESRLALLMALEDDSIVVREAAYIALMREDGSWS